jgi:hypothetical protein
MDHLSSLGLGNRLGLRQGQLVDGYGCDDEIEERY